MPERMSERLRARVGELRGKSPSDETLIDIVVELQLPGQYDAIGAVYEDVAQRIEAMAGREAVLSRPTTVVIAPYLFARLQGAEVEQLAADGAAPIDHISLSVDRRKRRGSFDPIDMLHGAIAEPLASKVRADPLEPRRVIVHLDVHMTTKKAREDVWHSLTLLEKRDPTQVHFRRGSDADVTHPYVFATLTGYAILALVDLDRAHAPQDRAINRIWEDAEVRAFITKSVATVKADAARIAFSAEGRDIVWAVLDSGIDVEHPHFSTYDNTTKLPTPLAHKDFRSGAADDAQATVDAFGHGTHVAGIIAGQFPLDKEEKPVAVVTSLNEAGAEEKDTMELDAIAGMAPRCKLVSLRVLEDDGTGVVSSLINAIDQIQRWNDHGRKLLIHGVNMSLGYPFDPEWFACGQSPICIEVNRLVQSGVVVVVAAGNSGYGYLQSEYSGAVSQGLGMSINDPGNADMAITVGSTHRTEPHRYGVSYFSSKGPTGDGRLKPDVLAPGERIISCASKQSRSQQVVVKNGARANLASDAYAYKEDSGTSMAAPHVSGIIAGFLSIRREYIGQPWDVKSLLMRSATDLGRDRNFQGAGLVDLMRAIQNV